MQSLAQLLNDGGHYTVNEDVTLHWDEAKCYLQLSSNWNNQRKPYLPRQYISAASVGSKELYTNEFNWTRKEEYLEESPHRNWSRFILWYGAKVDRARRAFAQYNRVTQYKKVAYISLRKKKKSKAAGRLLSTRWISSRKAPHLHTRPGVVARVRTHTKLYIYIHARTHTVCISAAVFVSKLLRYYSPASSQLSFFFFSVVPDRAPDLWFINYAIKKERERNGIHPRSFPMQLYQTNSTQRRFKWVLIYTAALCRKSWNFILLFELLFSRRGEREREKRRQGCCIQSVMGPCHYCP